MNDRDFARFSVKYTVAGECWEWINPTHKNGYGRFYLGGTMREAHRVAYEHYVGAVPSGLELDHLCRNPRCVNPKHLEAVTHAENSLRGRAPHVIAHHERRCIRGHLVEGENAAPHGRGNHPICRMCQRERDRQHHRRLAGIPLDRPVGRWAQ